MYSYPVYKYYTCTRKLCGYEYCTVLVVVCSDYTDRGELIMAEAEPWMSESIEIPIRAEEDGTITDKTVEVF